MLHNSTMHDRRRCQLAHKSLWDSPSNANHKTTATTATGLPHQRSHSSGFSSGSGSSSGFTPPPTSQPPPPPGLPPHCPAAGGTPAPLSSVTVHRSAELIEDDIEMEAAGDILE